MENFDPSAYSLVVQKARIDDHNYFVGRVLEFADVEVYEESADDAYKALIIILETLKAAADRNNKVLPSPKACSPSEEEDEFSGRVTLRLGKSLHRKVARIAAAEGVSLNMHIASVLAENTGEKSKIPSVPLFVQHMIQGQTILSTGNCGNQSIVVLATPPKQGHNHSDRIYHG